ncbi:microcystin-dependent protein [Pseudoduganella sp. FT25W]|uniref:Microcystin-dependent protein n=1 Tax=Duganella alba TaxID=2666081 RepID=A0A6L5QJC8_9BURK|nr:microcystin-dependent protein [Duganella alba]MRX17437.1 microcystin-dependent protein [Duganella alba]
MSSPFIGEIQIFGFGFAPPGWAMCDGSLVAVKDHPGLFSLIGVTYGGDSDGKFRLPNLAGRAVCGHGAGNGLTPRQPGDSFGTNNACLQAGPAPAETAGDSAIPAVQIGDLPHENRQPFVALNFYIALRGDMPLF